MPNSIPTRHHPRLQDFTGKVVGRLTVTGYVGNLPQGPTGSYKNTVWECRCSCGTVKQVTATYLRQAKDHASCGCYMAEKRPVKTCPNCGVTFSRMKNRSAIYCSRACANKHSGPGKVIHVEHTCAKCGKVRMVAPHAAARKFCSKTCAARSKGNSKVARKCRRCGKEFFKYRSAIAIGGGIYCSKDCFFLDKANPIFLAKADKGCARCPWSVELAVLVVHHKDRNRENNEPENLEVLCPNCHALEHFYAKDGPYRRRRDGTSRPQQTISRMAARLEADGQLGD